MFHWRCDNGLWRLVATRQCNKTGPRGGSSMERKCASTRLRPLSGRSTRCTAIPPPLLCLITITALLQSTRHKARKSIFISCPAGLGREPARSTYKATPAPPRAHAAGSSKRTRTGPGRPTWNALLSHSHDPHRDSHLLHVRDARARATPRTSASAPDKSISLHHCGTIIIKYLYIAQTASAHHLPCTGKCVHIAAAVSSSI